MPHGLRTFTTYAAAGLSGLLALAGLNLVADRLKIPGLSLLRDYITGNTK